MRYDYYIFDFDGTIADTGDGIRRSVAYALEKMGYPVPDKAVLDKFIGPPLLNAFEDYIGMSPEEAERAVPTYRERYVVTGLYESHLYPGIANLLRALHKNGAYVAVASAKPQFMVERLVPYFGLSDYIDQISGSSLESHTSDKKQLILNALPEGVSADRVCMVGDRLYDILAAKALGFAAIGAGYGYAPEGELEASGADIVFGSPFDMQKWFLDGDDPRGVLITLEGSDGCGKSTQIEKLRALLERRGFEAEFTREPGGCPAAEAIREIILSVDYTGMSPMCEALLYAAARAEHVDKVIRPALEKGRVVVCDRYLDSSIAYQAFGRELTEPFIRQINKAAAETRPDLTLLLYLDRETARKRMSAGAPLDRIELEKESFFARVDEGFRHIAETEPERVVRLDASESIDSIAAQIENAVCKALI